MNIDLSGKVAIVTGGAKGIGLGIAKRLAEAGAKIVIVDLKEAKLDKALFIEADVSDEEDVKKVISETVSAYGSIDILVNNAGIYPSIPISSMTSEDFEKVLAVNLKSVFLCTKYVAEQMIRQDRGGKIINITSIDALHPSSIGLAHYDASKHGVWGFTKNTALELAPHKIWVNAIAPGGIVTEGVEEAQKGADMSKVMESFLAKIPMKRMGEPDEIGKVALFLASDMSSYMTGSQIVVDGGVLLT
ncbi:SDR family oxidoreductase [Patescibacteria group bacterium]|nr:SDR family oxidoreductase [Patescibacteria group bacterium]